MEEILVPLRVIVPIIHYHINRGFRRDDYVSSMDLEEWHPLSLQTCKSPARAQAIERRLTDFTISHFFRDKIGVRHMHCPTLGALDEYLEHIYLRTAQRQLCGRWEDPSDKHAMQAGEGVRRLLAPSPELHGSDLGYAIVDIWRRFNLSVEDYPKLVRGLISEAESRMVDA